MVEEGYAGTRQRDPRVLSGEEETLTPDREELQGPTLREEVDVDQEGAVEQAEESSEEL